MCHKLGSYFQEKIPKRVFQFFTKIQGYNIWKKFQIGSVILMAQNTKQKKAQLIDYALSITVIPTYSQCYLLYSLKYIFLESSF